MNCPAPTRNPKINARNRLRAVREAMYGPVRVTIFGKIVDLDGRTAVRYWEKIAKRWGISYDEAIYRRCANCAAYDTSPDMVACGGASKDGSVGYCHAWNFTCAARRTCLSWSPTR